MDSPTVPELNPMFEEYLTKRLKEYAEAEARTTKALQKPYDDHHHGDHDMMDFQPESLSPDVESIDDGFSGSGSYLSTASCPVSPSPARHRFGYRPQRPTYDPTRGILKSITEGNTRRLSKLLGRRSSNAASLEDLTAPLTQAIRLGQDKCVISLLSAGADPNGFDDEGKSPLYLLMEVGGGNPEILRILLKFKANPDHATWNLKHTPLHLAAKKGFQVSVKHLLAVNAKPDMKDAAGNTPLMFAAKEGHVNIVRALIKGGADPNIKNLTNESSVHFAARGGNLDSLKEILELGGDLDERDCRGQTPLILACKGKYHKVVEVLLDYECDVNGQDTNTGKTALHWAVQNGETNTVTELLDAGADPNIKDKNWATPFMIALTVGKTDILDILLHARCDVISTDRSGNTALHLAATEGQAHLVPSLVEAGISVDLKGPSGVTPLMLAAFRGHLTTVKELLKYGANPNLIDRNRASALMYAIFSKSDDSMTHEIIKSLIRTNCDLDCCANLTKLTQHLSISFGDNVAIEDRLYSPLEVSFLKGKTAVFMMLIKAGADTSVFKGDVMPFVTERRPQDGDHRNKWYMLHCLQKEKEEIKSLKELCRRPALHFMSLQFNKHGKTLREIISLMPFSEKLKSFLAFGDIDEVENKYNVNLRDKPTQSASVVSPTGKRIPNPKNAGIHSLRSSFRSSSRFSRNSSTRQSLPIGYYSQNGPLASSTPKTTPTKTILSRSTTSSNGSSPSRNFTPRRQSQNFTPVSPRQQVSESPRRSESTHTNTIPRQKRQRNTDTGYSLGTRTGSSNNLELKRNVEPKVPVNNTPKYQYGSLRAKPVKKETEHEKLARAYDKLRNSMIAEGSISDVSSSSSSLSETKQKVSKRRERYSRIDPKLMLASPTLSSDNEVFFNDDSPRAGSDVSSNHSGVSNIQARTTSPTGSTQSSTEDDSSRHRSTLKYRNMYNNNLGIPTAMVSPTVAERKPDEAEVKSPADWGLKCLRRSAAPPAPELIVMDDQEKEVLENIVKETEEKQKEQKTYVPPDERPMRPMSEETRKAIYDKRWARIPNPAIIGDLQFSKNGITSTPDNTHSPLLVQTPMNQDSKSQNLRSSLRPASSPTGLEKKEVRFSSSSKDLNDSLIAPVKQPPPPQKDSEVDDPSIQRWGTMTLDDPEVLDNSENFTSSKSLQSPTGRKSVSRYSSSNNNGPTTAYTPSPRNNSVTSPISPLHLTPAMKGAGHGQDAGFRTEPLDNHSYHPEDCTNKNIYTDQGSADLENRNLISSFSRNLQPYSSLQARDSQTNYMKAPYATDDYSSSLDRASRKRSGMRSKDHPITDAQLTSPAEKKEIWSGDHEQNIKPEVKKKSPGSKIKMAFLRSKLTRR